MNSNFRYRALTKQTKCLICTKYIVQFQPFGFFQLVEEQNTPIDAVIPLPKSKKWWAAWGWQSYHFVFNRLIAETPLVCKRSKECFNCCCNSLRSIFKRWTCFNKFSFDYDSIIFPTAAAVGCSVVSAVASFIATELRGGSTGDNSAIATSTPLDVRHWWWLKIGRDCQHSFEPFSSYI